MGNYGHSSFRSFHRDVTRSDCRACVHDDDRYIVLVVQSVIKLQFRFIHELLRQYVSTILQKGIRSGRMFGRSIKLVTDTLPTEFRHGV